MSNNGNGNGGKLFWKIAGPVFLTLFLTLLGVTGKMLDDRLGRIEKAQDYLLDLLLSHMSIVRGGNDASTE